MNSEERNHPIRHILVALDNSPASLAVMEQAVELATTLQAELLGLYVEDIYLLRLTELSFSQEVGLFSATSRRLEMQYLERQFRSQAGQVRQALALLAEQAGITWNFRVARGVITTELLAAAAEVDLIILGRTGASGIRRRRLGSTARAVSLQAPRSTLILEQRSRLAGPVLVFYDGSAVAQKALVTAAQLMQNREGQLTVVVLVDDPQAVHRLQQEAKTWLDQYRGPSRYLWQRNLNLTKLTQLIRLESCQLVVVASDGTLLDHDTLLNLLDEVACPVLLVR